LILALLIALAGAILLPLVAWMLDL